MKISEMTEDQVRDYALKLEEEKAQYEEREKEKDGKIAELTDFNAALQRRNNELFLKVEQQAVKGTEEKAKEEKEEIETCEDFARRIAKGE